MLEQKTSPVVRPGLKALTQTAGRKTPAIQDQNPVALEFEPPVPLPIAWADALALADPPKPLVVALAIPAVAPPPCANEVPPAFDPNRAVVAFWKVVPPPTPLAKKLACPPLMV